MAKHAPAETITQRRTAFLDRIRASTEPPATPLSTVDSVADDSAMTAFPAAVPAGPQRPPSRERRTHPIDGTPLTAAGVSAETALLTATLITLARYTGQWDLRTGFVPSGATAVRSLAVELAPRSGFRANADAVERAMAEPAEPLTNAVTVLRMGDPEPPMNSAGREDARNRPANAERSEAMSPDCFLVEITGGTVTVEHDPARHEPAVAAGFPRHVEALLLAAAAAPGRAVAELPILDGADLAATVAEPNRTALARRPGTLVAAFNAAAARYGDRPALGDWRGVLDYAEVAAQTYRIARDLVATARVRREDRVAILVSRGDLRWVLGCLGVLEAGGAWLPLDPDTPAGRVATLLAEAGVRAVVTDSLLRDRIPAGPWQVIDLDADADRIAGHPATPTGTAVDPGNVAYAIYTSGSTGTPRAVLVEHDSVLNFTESMQRLFALRPEDRLIQFASPGFDVSVFEIFSALLTGAYLWITGENERLSVEGLSRVLEKERITVAELPPVLLEMMEPDRFPLLRLVSVGGEPFSGALATRWSAGRRFINGYGPTEATVAVTFKDCRGEWRGTPPIGRPGDNHRAYVLDDWLRPVPVGAVGELHLAGTGLARGYLGLAAVTADRFRPDPFGAGGRLYRTGDLARRAPDGELVFVARRDRQVKVRGQRVELGEVESALLDLPGIRAVVVGVDADTLGQSSLTAYLVAAPGQRLEPEPVRTALAARLPAYMLPSKLIEVPAIPRTRNGKADLPALAAAARAAGAAPGEPDDTGLSPTERQIRDRCYAVALPGVSVAAEADFFALGGTSLQAIRLMSLVRKLVGTEVELAQFFRRPTLRALATSVEAKVSRS